MPGTERMPMPVARTGTKPSSAGRLTWGQSALRIWPLASGLTPWQGLCLCLATSVTETLVCIPPFLSGGLKWLPVTCPTPPGSQLSSGQSASSAPSGGHRPQTPTTHRPTLAGPGCTENGALESVLGELAWS